MAGPCSAESRETVMGTALKLAPLGVKVFRAGVWKPRTRPGGFEGMGLPALAWLREAGDATGMITATEVATRSHVNAALDAGIEMLWIGARTSSNPFAVQEIADTLAEREADIPVMVKNPLGPDIELWAGAIERLYAAGVRRLGAIHRGFATYGPSAYRNMPLWHIPMELSVRFPNLPIIHDPSHTGGRRDLIATLSQDAIDMGFNGLFIESHCNPDIALSDASQQVTPENLATIISGLTLRTSTPSRPGELEVLRQQIDVIDTELLDVLARRMKVSRAIGAYKRSNGMSVLQSLRFNDLIADRRRRGVGMGMSPKFLKTLLMAIHDESIAQQLAVLRDNK